MSDDVEEYDCPDCDARITAHVPLTQLPTHECKSLPLGKRTRQMRRIT